MAEVAFDARDTLIPLLLLVQVHWDTQVLHVGGAGDACDVEDVVLR